MPSPYIVTTKRPVEVAEGFYSQPDHISRVAVATLEEDEVARRMFNWRDGDTLTTSEAFVLDAVTHVPQSGGTVGPLPDGTAIEVKPTTRSALLDEVGVQGHLDDASWPWPTQRICDAYNAWQACR